MIESNIVLEASNFTHMDLSQIAVDSGYYDHYTSSKFVGIHREQFVFEITGQDGSTGNVYLRYDNGGYDLEY